MLGWFQALLPRDERFFELFARHAQTIVAGAEALRRMLDGGDAVTKCCQAVIAREREADQITREVMIAVRRTFITPFDRGDIKDLITSMDDTIDQMQTTVKVITVFDVRSFTPRMREIGDAIVASAALVAEAMPLLASISDQVARLSAISEELSQLEGRTEEIHDNGVRELYQLHGSNDPMAFVIGNEVYHNLEQVVDRFDDVADQISSVVLDHV
jgi:predicted phosphate transport protein (TIGR00153 family)